MEAGFGVDVGAFGDDGAELGDDVVEDEFFGHVPTKVQVHCTDDGFHGVRDDVASCFAVCVLFFASRKIQIGFNAELVTDDCQAIAVDDG